MKKIIAATLFASVFASAAANATGGGSAGGAGQQLADGYNAIGDVATDINLARQFSLLAIQSRAGFIKNNFDITLSANVVGGLIDEAANNRMGVEAASNKGYVYFTGSSVGGSVAQCGQPVTKDTTNLAASLVDGSGGGMDMDLANGCGRTL